MSSFFQELFTSRKNYENGDTFVGQADRLWYEPVTNSIRISDGVTPGGQIVASGLYYDTNTGNLRYYDPATQQIVDVVISGGGGGGGVQANWTQTATGAPDYIKNKPNLSIYAVKANLSTVATSGSYNDLLNLPALFSGSYNDLSNKPDLSIYARSANLSTVATSGSYNDLSNKPDLSIYARSANLSVVATTGNYNDLSNKPTLFSGNYTDLTNKPYLFSGAYADLSGKPNLSIYAQSATLSTIATSGSYNDLINKPFIPNKLTDLGILDGSYGQSLVTDGAGNFSFASISGGGSGAGSVTVNSIYANGQANVHVGLVTTINFDESTGFHVTNQSGGNVKVSLGSSFATWYVSGQPTLAASGDDSLSIIAGNNIVLTSNNTPGSKSLKIDANLSTYALTSSLSNVAISGSYNDLSNKPTLFSGNYNDLSNKPTLFSGSYNDLTDKPNLANVATSGSYNDLSNKPNLSVYALSSNLSNVAVSGSYNDLINIPPTAAYLNANSNSGLANVSLLHDIINFIGTSPISTSITQVGNNVFVQTSVANATTNSVGVASFDPVKFTVNNGFVSTNPSGISNSDLANSSITIGSTTVNLGSSISSFSGINSLQVDTIVANNFTGTNVYAAQIGNVGTILTGTLTHSTQNNIDVMSGLTSFGTLGVTTTAQGNLNVVGNLNVTGNITTTGNVYNVTITGKSGQFFGDISGFNALYAGIGTGYFIEPQMAMQISTNFNGYAGVNMQNINGGPLASTDTFWTPDNGSAADTFLDIGIASSNYSYPGYSIIKPNDAYIIAYGNTVTNGGNLIVNTGLKNDIIFATNGSAPANEVMRITGANVVNIKSTVISTNTNSGALVVAGGVGIGDGLNITNNANVGGNLYVGGIIPTGTWQANTINSHFGGTGITSYSPYDLLIGNVDTTLHTLGLGTAGQFLQVNSSGTALVYASLDGGTF